MFVKTNGWFFSFEPWNNCRAKRPVDVIQERSVQGNLWTSPKVTLFSLVLDCWNITSLCRNSIEIDRIDLNEMRKNIEVLGSHVLSLNISGSCDSRFFKGPQVLIWVELCELEILPKVQRFLKHWAAIISPHVWSCQKFLLPLKVTHSTLKKGWFF